jgi:alpha,alpha-trehalose phosphorylase
VSLEQSAVREDDAPHRADPRAAAIDPWRLTQTQWLQEKAARDETLFALSNGAVGVRGGFEESYSATQASFIAGVWERAPIHYHEKLSGFAKNSDIRVPVADATPIRIRFDGAAIDPADGECLAFERTLDFRSASLSRRLRWRAANGLVFDVNAQRIVSMAHPGLMCIRWTLRLPEGEGRVTVESGIDGGRATEAQGDDPRVGVGAGLALRVTHVNAGADGARLAQSSNVSGISVVCAQDHRVEGLRFTGERVEASRVWQVFTPDVDSGGSVTIEKYVVYAWTLPQAAARYSDLYTSARLTLDAAMSSGIDALLEVQANDFARFWDAALIAIDGGEQARRDEQALRFNLFHLFQAANRDGTGGIAAKGVTGEGYEGHVFWDSETFVLPVFGFTAPELMKPSLIWRFRMLDHARAHAREMNHARGALYPWRTIGGDECSSHYPSGSAQYHINAAVAFAVRLYAEASGDRAFLCEMGAEILGETARIWLQVGHFNARRGGAFCIDAVTGPDEYTALVDNNYYTNRMAQIHLRYAVSTLRTLARDEPTAYKQLAQKIELSDAEIDAWSVAADAMWLPYDENLGIIAQDDTFLDKPVWDFFSTPDDHYPLLIHYHPLTLFRHQVCKQADAVLALVLAGEELDRATKRRSFDYYETVTVHDSTLSASTFAVLAAEVGLVEKAEKYFRSTLRVDLDDLHGNTSHGAHMAAMAGSWHAFAWGFGGLRVLADAAGRAQLKFDPVLPTSWSGYRFGVVWQGRRIDVAIDANGASYSLRGEPLQVMHGAQAMTLDARSAQSRPLSPPYRHERIAFPRPVQALIFDLDGVIADTAKLHAFAWQRLTDELGLPWDERNGERTKGVDRMASLDIVLGAAAKKYTSEQKRVLADRKNGYYRDSITSLSANDLLPGAREALHAARAAGLKIALASASRSAKEVVESLGVAALFDVIVDAAVVAHPKPDPEIFQRAAAALGVHPATCLGLEDAQAGIAAIKSAGMAALGVGDEHVLAGADAVIPNLQHFDLSKFVSKVGSESSAKSRGSPRGAAKEKMSVKTTGVHTPS